MANFNILLFAALQQYSFYSSDVLFSSHDSS